MSVHQIGLPSRLSQIVSEQPLRPGQVVQGEVLKLYPEQKARIHIGARQFIAQLQASLSLGARYHFRVERSDDLIHLKVLGQQLKKQNKDDAVTLLQQLDLKPSKANAFFLERLINDRIPFDRQQLNQAFLLLNGAKSKAQAGQVLTEMIARKMPMTDGVFRAFMAVRNHGLGEQINGLLQQLKQDNPTLPLTDQLRQLTERPLDGKALLVQQITNENQTNQTHLLNLLKAFGSVHPSMDLNTWKSEWQAFSAMAETNKNNFTSLIPEARLPFQLDHTAAIQSLQQLNKTGNETILNVQQFLQQWKTKIQTAISTNTPLSLQDFTQLKQQLAQLLLPLSNQSNQSMSAYIQNNPASLKGIITVLETLSDQQTHAKVEQLMTSLSHNQRFLNAAPGEQLLNQIHQTLSRTGLAYENNLVNNHHEPTIKEILLQLVSDGKGNINEKATQLLHLINGLQLNSVNESDNFIQASMLIPGGKLKLNKDLKLEFEGSKTKEGDINPDYCRIVFYLDLSHVRETVIDMNIQKRSVAVTVYNNNMDSIKNYTENLKPVLKEGLEKIDYHLSAVLFKSLIEQETWNKENDYLPSFDVQRGVDFRI